MKINRLKYIIAILLLFISSLFVWRISQSKGSAGKKIDFQRIPLQVGEWQGKDLKIPQMVYDILETKDVFSRQYQDKKGDTINLTFVYTEDNPDSIHPPEICYLGGGVEIKDKYVESIPLSNSAYLSVNVIKMQSSQGTIKAWYWFVVGKRFVSNYYLQQAYLIFNSLRGKKMEGALIRVSVNGASPDLEKKAKLFIQKVVPELKKILL